MRMSKQYPHVFQPLKVGPVTLKNRIQFSPMVCCLSNAAGEVTAEYRDFLAMQARTGAGLVTIGSTVIDHETGGDFYGEIDVTKDTCLPGMKSVADAVHRYGAKLSVELCHSGRGAAAYLLQKPYAIAPSVVPQDVGYKYIKEMDQHDIDHIVEAYADCALRCKKAGFDMVMIHAAHGNLIGQFLSPFTNRRNDIYGGSFENRCRFAMEVIRAVRNAVGRDMGVEMRVSAEEVIPGGIEIDETIQFIKKAEPYVDLVHVSRGLIGEAAYSFYSMPPYYHPYCHNVPFAEKIRSQVNVPIAVVGSIKTMEQAEEITAKGAADVVAMARQLLADPDTIKKAMADQPEKTRPCLRCMDGCAKNCGRGFPLRCTVNPVVGREGAYTEIRPALTKKKVMVVGGGAAGMMAAQTLVKRGHDVTLYEKSDHLGGQLAEICNLPFKTDLREYKEWDIRTTMECGAKIVLNTAVTREMVEREEPDALFIAAGATPLTPPVPGIEFAKQVIEVDNDRVEVGDTVVVCGGGLSGLECALALAMKGKKVTVVDMIPVENFGSGQVRPSHVMLMKLLADHNVTLIGNSKVQEIREHSVVIMDRNWKVTELPADTTVASFGMRSNMAAAQELSGIIAETYIIGDNDRVANLLNANMTAFDYAVEC